MKQEYISILNRVLYEHDPVGTCCVENECLDEYIDVATNMIGNIYINYNYYPINMMDYRDFKFWFILSFRHYFGDVITDRIPDCTIENIYAYFIERILKENEYEF